MRELLLKVEKLVADWEKERDEKGARVGCALFCVPLGEGGNIDGDKLFIPASNNKLWTSAVALDQLGSQYRWETQVHITPDQLMIQGGGDPGFCFEDAQKIAQRLRVRGVERLPKKWWINNGWCDDHPWGAGWKWDHLASGYCPRIEGLIMEGNRIHFQANPQTEIPQFCSHGFGKVRVSSHCTWTDGESEVVVQREDHTNDFYISGKLSRREPEVTGAVWSGPSYFVEGFRQACLREGIQISEKTQILYGDRLDEKGLRLIHYSNPLSQIVLQINRESNNLSAEILLRTLGKSSENFSEEKGIHRVLRVLHNWGLQGPTQYVDGSGLSMDNLSSPNAIVELLAYQLHSPMFPLFLNSLSRYGKVGTLADRKTSLPSNWDVAAKTGSLVNVRTLSGYFLQNQSPIMVFSLLINGLSEEANGEDLQDRFLHMLAGSM